MLLLLLGSTAVRGQENYEIDWFTIDGGGGTSSGEEYIVDGTIGQADAGVMSGGDFELFGGFWSGYPSCIVDLEHFARFAQEWFYIGSGLDADLHSDNIINRLDLKVFVDYWLCYCPYDWPLK